MKKLVIICTFTLFILGWLSQDSIASHRKYHEKQKKAEDTNITGFNGEIEKRIESDGEVYYEVGFECELENGEELKSVQIKTPSNKKLSIKNTLGLDAFEIDFWDMAYEDLEDNFPEGKYTVTFSPKKLGKITFNLTHDFPSTPVITYPEDGATDVPQGFTLEWESLSDSDDVDGLTVYIQNEEENFEYEEELSVDDTSYTIPEGLLQPDTEYEIRLMPYNENNEYITLITIKGVSFTTSSE